MHVAWLDESVTAAQPLMVVPFSVKPTLPVGEEPPSTIAVKVTARPMVEGFMLEDTTVVVGAWLLLFTI